MEAQDGGEALVGRLLPEGVAQEGFTSSSLQLYLENIKLRSRQVKAAILCRLDEGAQSGTVLADEVAAKLQQVLGPQAVRASWVGSDLLPALERFSHAASECSAARSEVALLEAEANWSKRLVEIKECTRAGDFVGAAKVLQEIKQVLGIAPSHGADATPAPSPNPKGTLQPENQPTPLSETHPELYSAEKELKKALGAWWKAAVHADEDAKAIELKKADHKDEIKAFWDAAESVGISAHIARKAGDMLMNTAIKPVVLEAGVEVQASDSALRLTTPAGKAKKPKPHTACNILEGVLEFVAAILSGGDPRVCSQIGENLWPRIVKGLESKHLARLEPKDAAGLAAFQKAATAAVELEDKARELGLWQSPSAPVREYADDIIGGFQVRRVQGLLADARDIIMQPPGGDIFDAGKALQGSLLPLHVHGQEQNLLGEGPVKVTSAGLRLPQLMEEAVAAAVEAESSEDALSLCRAAEGMAAMMCSLPQAAYGQQLQVPQLAALYYNDCLQAACAAATLPLAFGPRLAAKLGEKLSFMEAAVSLQDAGQAVIDAMHAAQRQQLMEVLDEAGGFDLYQQMAGLTCRKAISATVHLLKRVAAALREVLSPPVFIQFAGSLLQAACSRIAQDLLSKSDFSADESEEIADILLPFLQDSPAVMLGLDTSAEPAEKSQDPLLLSLQASAPSWIRLQAIVKLLKAHLAHIPSMWQSGELRSAGLSAADVHHMILALFEDSKMRDEELDKII